MSTIFGGGMMGGAFGNMLGCNKLPNKSIVNSTDPFNDGSLIAKYQLNGDATDLCGNYDGEATDVAYDTGKHGQAGNFNGSSSEVQHNTSWGLEESAEISISLFVKCASDLEDESSIVTFGGTGSVPLIALENTRFIVEGDNDENWDYLPSKLEDLWHHCVIVINYSKDIIYLYVDNVLSLVLDNDGNTKIGDISGQGFGLNVDGDHEFAGLIDQVEIYNRALTPQEVEMLYTQSKYICDPTQAIDGLIAHYPLDGTAEDIIGNYHGTEEGGLTYEDTEMGVAAGFDGDDDYIEISNSDIKLDYVTISMWLQYKHDDEWKPYITKNNHNSEASFALSGMSDDYDNVFRWSASVDGDNNVQCKTDSELEDDKIYHILGTFDGEYVRLYIDNELISEEELSGTLYDNSLNIFMMRYADTGDWITPGNIKNVRIYNRALSEDEISTIYNYEKLTRSNIVVDRGLIAYYPLKDNSLCHTAGQYDGVDNGDISYNGIAMYTDGDYIAMPETITVNDLSVSAWVNLDDVNNDSNQICTNNDTNEDLQEIVIRNDGVLRVDFDTSGYGVEWDISDVIFSGLWYHITVTRIDDVCTLYINGMQFGASQTTVTEAFNIVRIMRDDNFYGYMSDLRIYNRGISSSEVITIYEAEKKIVDWSPPPIPYLIIDENSTLDTIADLGLNTSDIEGTFYTDDSSDEKGVGWGTNDDEYKILKLKVPADATKVRIIFSGSYNDPSDGMGYFNLYNVEDDNSKILSLYDAWHIDSEGQSLTIDDSTIYSEEERNEVNRDETINIPSSCSNIYVRMKGYTSSYGYTKRYIKHLEFLTD